MKRWMPILLLPLCTVSLASQDLEVTRDDVRIEQSTDGGYILTVKKKPDLGSVLLTESTKDPGGELATYAYRSAASHPMNSEERRMLDGDFLDNSELGSLIDSTPEPDEEFGEAFKIFVPWVVEYGYPWTRQGRRQVVDGTYINIRAFSKPYGDYSGGFTDNPFVVSVTQRALEEEPEEEYMTDAVSEYERIAEESEGTARKSSGKEDVVEQIAEMVRSVEGESLDLVLAIDTTKSMEDDVPFLKENLIPLLTDTTAGFERFRLGLVYYKDYHEEYLTRSYPFRDDLAHAQRVVDTIRVRGGRDIPEAVNEALHVSVTGFTWEADERMVILIGDAPPHPLPRGRVTREVVQQDAAERGVRLNTIILPQ